MLRDRDYLRRLIKDMGFDRLEDQLMQAARPSIRVYTHRVPDESSIPIGSSKIGGRPDLPAPVAWPVTPFQPHLSLPFVAQFDLKDLKPYDEENLLPESGLLSFFGDPPYGRDAGAALFYEGTKAVLERKEFPVDIRVLPPDEGGVRYDPCRVTFTPEMNLPFEIEGELVLPEGKTWDQLDELIDAANYPLHRQTVNRLLGVADDVPADLRRDCQLKADRDNPYGASKEDREKAESRKKEWQLLFQMDSDVNAGMMWSDMGVICFYIRHEDLKQQNFSNVCLAFFSP